MRLLIRRFCVDQGVRFELANGERGRWRLAGIQLALSGMTPRHS